MPGKRIKDLTPLSGAGSANNDDVVIFDADADVTKRISRSQLAEGMQVDVQVFSNKTINLGSNTLTGTTAQFNTALSDNNFATQAGSETLTNKTINARTNTLQGSDGSRLHLFTTVAALLADTGTYTTYAAGQIVEAGGFRYEVAASGASDHHVTTAGGVKLYVLAGEAGFDVRAFGTVGNGSVDDTAAFQRAANATRAINLAPGETYRIAGTVTVASPLVVYGHGGTITMGSNIAFDLAAPMEVYNVNFQSTATGLNAGLAIFSQNASIGGSRIVGCKFGRVNVALWDDDINDAVAQNNGIRIVDCTYAGDYTGMSGGDTNNILDVRGASAVYITGCDFNVVGIERFVKISGSCRRVFIQRNSFKCNSTTVGKQAIDLFADTREVIVSENIADLNGFSAFVENKNGDNSSFYGEPSEVCVSNNTVKMAGAVASSYAVGIFGAWGLSEETLTRNTAKVIGNTLLRTSTGSTAADIIIRGMTHGEASNNTLWRNDDLNFAHSIEVSNCQNEIISNNQIQHGTIVIGAAQQHPGGTTYTKAPSQVLVEGNQIASFGAQNGVFVTGAGTIANISVLNNTMRPKAGTGSSGVIRVDITAISQLAVIGNDADSLTTADVLLNSGGSVAAYRMTANTWQFGSVVANPGSIAAAGSFALNIPVKGAAVGDEVKVGFPYDMQGANVAAWVNAANFVRVLIRNQTAGSLTFLSGTFSARTSRG